MPEYPSILRRADDSGVPQLLARLLIGGLFLYMGVEKVGHPMDFLKQIRLYHMLPETPAVLLNATAVVLPWLEVACGVALMLGVWARGAAALVFAMLAVFTPAILLRALAIQAETGTPFLTIAFDCGCGSGAVITWKKLLANTGLGLITLVVLLSQSRRFRLTNLLDDVRGIRPRWRRSPGRGVAL